MRTLVLTACIASFCVPSGAADSSFPVVGGYGFDWLAPDSAQCVRIADPKRFQVCEFHTSGAFGLDLAYHACPTTAKRGEFLVFQSQSACQEALETMRANAP